MRGQNIKNRMAEVKTPRLMAAAKEFNIGTQTLIEFLVSKNFNADDLKPTAKLTEDMYSILQSEFQQDKVAKQKAEQIDLPKGATAEQRKKKDEEDISFKRKEEKVKAKPVEVEEPVVAPAEPEVPQAEPQPEPEVKIQEEVKEEPTPQVVEAQPEPAPSPKAEETPAPEISNLTAPEIEGPKIVGTVDLSEIGKPKKSAKKAEPKPSKEVPPAPAKEAEPSAPAAEQKETKPAEDEPAVIENIQAQKITGPKVVGRIELPTEHDTRPKRTDAKGPRKRIPVQKRPVSGQGQPANPQDRQNRPGNQRPGQGQGQRFHGKQQGHAHAKREDKVIDEKEIQDKLKQTQAKLSGAGGRGKSLKAKYRKAKREEHAEQAGAENENTKLQVTEFVTVSELAGLMDVSFADVISKCMNLGIMVSINQRLEADVIELVAGEFNYEVEFIGVDDAAEIDTDEPDDDPENQIPRSPIVTIMGHVDHGKTSLLDYIRNTNVIGGEAGGITQHIGAYEVTTKTGRTITFLDTPGHEAFTAMRARGAKITDIAVIVIAADDAVMPQTKEAISHAQAASVPMIFAINKMDKESANPEKIKEQLAQMNILVESWGGKYQSQEISAKKGLNVDLLLEKILLETDILELKANPEKPANGTVIEASLDKGRGYVATVLVQNGTLKTGDMIVSGQFFGKVKAMYNERNTRLNSAPPSTPALILGLNGAPQAGETFKVFSNESEARETATRRGQILREQGIRSKKHITLDEIGRRLALGNFKELNVIIKGDVDGSVEALSDSLQKLSTEEIVVKVIHKAVGAITESDVTLANASDAIIIGFNVRPSLQAAKLAESESIEIKTYSIIYNAIEEIKSAMEGMLEPTVEDKVLGNVEIRETYKFDKATVAGCFVLDGKIARNNRIRLIRDGIVIFTGELASLKRFRDDVKEVSSNMECGLVIRNYNDIKVGDIVEAFEEVEIKRTL